MQSVIMGRPRPSKGGPEDEENLTRPMKLHSQALTPASGREILSLQSGLGLFLGQFSGGDLLQMILDHMLAYAVASTWMYATRWGQMGLT